MPDRAPSADQADEYPHSRDPLTWPFAQTSIWNMPIGSDAVYMPADITAVTEFCPHAAYDVIILTPGEPLMDVYFNDVGWTAGGDARCVKSSDRTMLRAPIPAHFVVTDPYTPDFSAAILDADGRTLHQNQPFCKGAEYDYAVTQYIYPDVDLFSDGIQGAHGGSGLSSIGGTIRLGELTPGSVIRHALKCSVPGHRSLYYDERTGGFRWPAVKADDHAEKAYGGEHEYFRMGALMALRPSFDLGRLKTEPGRIVGRACQDYGIYVVDNSGTWDTFQIATEWSPDGRVVDEFHRAWGHPFSVHRKPNSQWWQDIETIFTNLHVIANNGPHTIGGGGTPRQPLAPPLRLGSGPAAK